METSPPPPSSSLKRQLAENPNNGREKRVAASEEGSAPPTVSLTRETIFRLLCPGGKTGSVIGKGGSIIKAIREETGARIKVADAVPGTDERVIVISANERVEEDWSPAQEGLLRVHGRIVEEGEGGRERGGGRAGGGEGGGGEGGEGGKEGGSVVGRMLVASNQIGCLLGKGGSIISQMRKETGAQIRVLQKEQLPGCALPSDELVQVTGELDAVVLALKAITSRLRMNPPRHAPSMDVSHGGMPHLPMTHHHAHMVGPIFQSLPGGATSAVASWQPMPGQHVAHLGLSSMSAVSGNSYEVVFRILCNGAKIGSLIGKGGSIIKQLREETGSRIKIADAVPDVEERVVILSGTEIPGSQFSSAQEALYRIQAILLEQEGLDENGLATTRLLVPSNQIGCLLGKGGSIISEMRRTSRANIRILPKEQLPGCALESDELVQLMGDPNAVRIALQQVSKRLRANPPREGPKEAGVGGSQNAVVVGGGGGGESYFSTPNFPQAGSTVYGQVGGGGNWHHTESAGGPPPTAQGLLLPTAGLRGLSTINVQVPVASVGSIIGKAGANIAQIRNISGARVKLHEVQDGSVERTVEICGTADQLQAAQSLLQAFIISGTSAREGGGGSGGAPY